MGGDSSNLRGISGPVFNANTKNNLDPEHPEVGSHKIQECQTLEFHTLEHLECRRLPA